MSEKKEKSEKYIEQCIWDISQIEDAMVFEKKLFEAEHQKVLQKIYNYQERINELKKIVKEKKDEIEMKDTRIKEKIGNCNETNCKYFNMLMRLNCSFSDDDSECNFKRIEKRGEKNE